MKRSEDSRRLVARLLDFGGPALDACSRVFISSMYPCWMSFIGVAVEILFILSHNSVKLDGMGGSFAEEGYEVVRGKEISADEVSAWLGYDCVFAGR